MLQCKLVTAASIAQSVCEQHKIVYTMMQEAQLGDIRWRQAVFEVLLSYHPFWLRLGLELVAGCQMPADTGMPQDHSDVCTRLTVSVPHNR